MDQVFKPKLSATSKFCSETMRWDESNYVESLPEFCIAKRTLWIDCLTNHRLARLNMNPTASSSSSSTACKSHNGFEEQNAMPIGNRRHWTSICVGGGGLIIDEALFWSSPGHSTDRWPSTSLSPHPFAGMRAISGDLTRRSTNQSPFIVS